MDVWILFATIVAYPLEITELERYLAYIEYEPFDSMILVVSLQLIKIIAILTFITFGEFFDLELERLAELEFQLAVRRHYLDLRRLG